MYVHNYLYECRRPSAFNLLKEGAYEAIMKRIEREEKRAKDLAEKAEKERQRKAMAGIVEEGGKIFL